MRIAESLLRRAVRNILWEQEKPFGDYLFGDHRDLPSATDPEYNTPEEEDLQNAFYDHYRGDTKELSPWVNQLAGLRDQGLYTDILSPPPSVRYAYRMMHNISREVLTKMLGHEPNVDNVGELYEESGATFQPSTSRSGKSHYSWTINPSKFESILKDWGGFSTLRADGDDELEFLVFLRAPIAGNNFLMNPEEAEYLARNYAYQEEVISVGPIECDRIWYVPMLFSTGYSPVRADRAATKKFTSSATERLKGS